MITGLMAALALAAAQPDPREAAVTATVQRFFDAMAKEDRGAIAQVVLPGTVFTSVRPAGDGVTSMRRLTVEEFSKNLRPGLDERMWAPRISLRGATCWPRSPRPTNSGSTARRPTAASTSSRS